MPYMTLNGDFRTTIDLPQFAVDLARELGARVLPAGEYPRERQSLRLDEATVLHLGANTWKKFVSASIEASDVPWDDRNMYDKTHRTESATVNPDARPIATIARDIKRRVIDASAGALERQRAHAARQVANRSGLREIVAKLQAIGGLDVRADEKAQQARVFGNAAGHYLSGTVYPDGSVSFERIGSVDFETFKRIVAILNEGKQS